MGPSAIARSTSRATWSHVSVVGPAPGAVAEPRAQGRVGQHRLERPRHLVVGPDQQAGVAVADAVDVPGDAGGDGRGAARGGLGEREPPALVGGRAGDHPRRSEEVDELVVGHVAAQVHPLAGVEVVDDPLDVRALVPLADDDELEVGYRGCGPWRRPR